MYHLIFEVAFRDIAQGAREALDRTPINNSFRGWRYDQEEFRPPYDSPDVTISQILGLSDEGERADNPERMSGDLIHSLYNRLVSVAEDFFNSRTRRDDLLKVRSHLQSVRDATIDTIVKDTSDVKEALGTGKIKAGWVDSQKKALGSVWDYESSLLAGLLDYEYTAYPGYARATLAARCLPFESEIECDGGLIHLSKNLRIDARMTHRGSMIIDVKTGTRNARNRLGVVAYALAWESRETTAIDIGCVYYVQTPAHRPTPLIECDVFPITTTLRQAFIEKRNDLIVKINETGEKKNG